MATLDSCLRLCAENDTCYGPDWFTELKPDYSIAFKDGRAFKERWPGEHVNFLRTMPLFCAALVFHWTTNPPRGKNFSKLPSGVENDAVVSNYAMGTFGYHYTQLVAYDGTYDVWGNLEVGYNAKNQDAKFKRLLSRRDAGSGTHLSPVECEGE